MASVLKSYLRELPEPLIPYDYFEVFLTAARCKSQLSVIIESQETQLSSSFTVLVNPQAYHFFEEFCSNSPLCVQILQCDASLGLNIFIPTLKTK